MANIEIRSNSILFSKTKDTGPVHGSSVIAFPRHVQHAVAVLTGYSATFENREDHNLGRLALGLTTTIDTADNRLVHVTGSFELRDWTGTFDDAYSGTIEFAVLAELVPATVGGAGKPRDDLLITDAEITQAIQHFRSATFLDTPNVFPDNSIRLVADKATGIRLWVDYDRASGLASISMLSGTLTVVDAAGASTVLFPLNTIVPRYESQLARINAADTLNFVIPEDLCNGRVTITARVFDQSDINQRSADFQRMINFEDMPAIRVFAVGINYTGSDTVSGKPTSAPLLSDFTNLFSTTELLYPIPSVALTGYMTMGYAKAAKSDISKGCDHFDDIQDAVKDLRGDSTDIFYGLLNAGVDTGSVGGCGGDGGAGVGRIGRPGTAAHEIGHIFGRQHAPCDNVTRCAHPLNIDDDYPVYSGYDSDSIGECGFNTLTGDVLDPGNAHDMMGYSSNAWISPYTYKALMTRIPVDDDGGADILQTPENVTGVWRPVRGPITIEERIPMLAPHLFTRFRINRDRSVEWKHAFNFPAWPQSVYGRKTDFVLEQRDANGEVLLSEYLYEDRASCGCSGDKCLWPKKFSQYVPFDPQAKRLVIFECDKEILSEPIPDPPRVRLTCKGGDNPSVDHILCSWSVSEDADNLWYLLQWRDRRGVWRGVAPRTQQTEWKVLKILWGRDAEAALRVLATSGIATGVAECSFKLARPKENRRGTKNVNIHIIGGGGTAATVELPPIVRVAVTGVEGGTIRNPQVRWYDSNGGQIGRGRSLALYPLPVGVHAIRAAVLNTGEGAGEQSWLFERTRDGRYFWHRGTITYPDPECPQRSISASNERKHQG